MILRNRNAWNVTVIKFQLNQSYKIILVKKNVMMVIMQIPTKSVNNAILIVKNVQRMRAQIVMKDMN